MPASWIFLIILALAAVAYVMGRKSAMRQVDGDQRKLHSLPYYYGLQAFLLTLVPSTFLLLAWMFVQPILVGGAVDGQIATQLESEGQTADAGQMSLYAQKVNQVVQNLTAAGADKEAVLEGADPAVAEIAQSAVSMTQTGQWAMTAVVLILALVGFFFALRRITPEFRGRNASEKFMMGLLIGCSTIAIMTTAGIVLSMLFETINFFGMYSWTDFYFGTEWTPRFQGGSDLGILPLIWGTLYISVVALLVAVPIGMFAAIYMAEYASRRVRSFAKPLIEILAGIPTIVYGLFALTIVGPMLRDYFALPLGLGNSASSVMTAGLVMGVMLIPFVSSLSDDIITSVPQSLRDGSLGLGSTKSETIRQVVLPAALPGIVGAILLAASRAIGETMIVVLGAGTAAKLGINPFEAMTTITVKIVSQLTGDQEFSSPETLVAFALGLTLFVLTLGLNVFALYIVRKYREQYE